MNDRPMTQALLAACRHDLAGIRAQLDLMTDDELDVLGSALWDVATELRFTRRDRGLGYELDVFPVGDICGDGSGGPRRRCPAPDCDRMLTSTRSRYCSGRCRMRALRRRRTLNAQTDAAEEVTAPGRRPLDQCVYECTLCGERLLGERRCPECHLFTRNLGLGAPCPECDHPIVLAELLPAQDAGDGLSVPTNGRPLKGVMS